MTAQTSPQNRYDMEARLVAKSWKDEAFKQQLLSNPKATIEEEFGVQFSEELNIQVVEENPNTLYITMPVRPNFDGAELSDQELETVAGGTLGAVVKTAVSFVEKHGVDIAINAAGVVGNLLTSNK